MKNLLSFNALTFPFVRGKKEKKNFKRSKTSIMSSSASTALLLVGTPLASPIDVESLTRSNGGVAPAVATRSSTLSPSDFSSSSSSSSSFSLVRSVAAGPSGHASGEGAAVLRVAAAALAPGGKLELAEEVRRKEALKKRATSFVGLVTWTEEDSTAPSFSLSLTHRPLSLLDSNRKQTQTTAHRLAQEGPASCGVRRSRGNDSNRRKREDNGEEARLVPDRRRAPPRCRFRRREEEHDQRSLRLGRRCRSERRGRRGHDRRGRSARRRRRRDQQNQNRSRRENSQLPAHQVGVQKLFLWTCRKRSSSCS